MMLIRIRLTQYKTLVVLFVMITSGVLAQNTFSLKSFTGSVEGTSNFRDWNSDIKDIVCTGTLHSKDDILETITDVEIKILVESIKGKEGETMDRKTYEAFRYDKHPYITYTFPTARVIVDSQNNVTIEPAGTLTMAGKPRAVVFPAKGKMQANGDLQLHVSKKLKLSDFNIEPPTALLGAVKVGDEITLTFDLLLTRTKIK